MQVHRLVKPLQRLAQSMKSKKAVNYESPYLETKNRLVMLTMTVLTKVNDIELGNQLAQDLGVKVKYVSVDAANRAEYLISNKVDITLANFTVTDERKKQVDFALPYMKVSLGVVSPKDKVIKDVKELEGKTLIVTKGTNC